MTTGGHTTPWRRVLRARGFAPALARGCARAFALSILVTAGCHAAPPVAPPPEQPPPVAVPEPRPPITAAPFVAIAPPEPPPPPREPAWPKHPPIEPCAAPGIALSLVLDRSGSMTGVAMEQARAAARAVVDGLRDGDLLEIIAFDSQPVRAAPFRCGTRRKEMRADVAAIALGGGTEIFSALDLAYFDLGPIGDRPRYILLLTDGQSPTTGIRELVTAMVAEAITVSTIGLGFSTDDALLEQIADVGGGRYHRVIDATMLPQIFRSELAGMQGRAP